MKPAWTPAERRRLEAELAHRRELRCPSCGAILSASTIAPPPEVAYVRTRVLVICPGCHRSASLDLRR